jgi:hypothetical protein
VSTDLAQVVVRHTGGAAFGREFPLVYGATILDFKLTVSYSVGESLSGPGDQV